MYIHIYVYTSAYVGGSTAVLPSASRDKSVTRLHCTLQQVFFDGYNRKFAVDASHEAVNWPECEERVEAFKRQHIYQSMIDTEITSMSYPHIPRLPACRILTYRDYQHVVSSHTEITSMSYPHIPRLPACRILTCRDYQHVVSSHV